MFLIPLFYSICSSHHLYLSLLKTDPTRLRTLTQNTTLSHSKTYPKTPHKTQRSPLSPLQRFVKDARVNILEPVLGLGLSPNPGSGVSTPGGAATSEVAEVDIDGEGGTAHGNKDLRGGKKKKGGLTVVLPPLSQVQLRNRNANRVFLPTPTTASSSATSTSTPTFNLSRPRTRRLTTAERHSRASTIDFQTPATPTLSFPSSTHTPTPPPYPLPHKTSEAHQNTAQSTRTRRPSSKFSKGDFVDCTAPKRRIRSSTIIKDGEGVKMEPCTPASSSTVAVAAQSIKLGKRARRASSPPIFQPPHPPHNSRSNNSTTKTKTKPKPETYRQAWSVSEQHLLEQLLDEIPDGEKNRWVADFSEPIHRTKLPLLAGGRRYLKPCKENAHPDKSPVVFKSILRSLSGLVLALRLKTWEEMMN